MRIEAWGPLYAISSAHSTSPLEKYAPIFLLKNFELQEEAYPPVPEKGRLKNFFIED